MTVRHVTRHNMLVHEKQHLIFCSFCEETFRSREDLKSHSKEVHSKDCVVDCPFCEHSFTNQDSCDQHEIDIHDMVIRYFSCDLCDKSCTSKVELAKHKLVVHVHQGKQQKRYCVICKEACIDYHARLRHMKLIHDGRKKVDNLTQFSTKILIKYFLHFS